MEESKNVSNGITKDDLKKMWEYVTSDREVTYMTISTAIGPIKCGNKHATKLKMFEETQEGNKELTYDYRLDAASMEEVYKIFAQANATNMDEMVTPFRIFSHKFYAGEVTVVRPRSEILFYDTYFIVKNAEIMDEQFKQLIVLYKDFEYIFTQ